MPFHSPTSEQVEIKNLRTLIENAGDSYPSGYDIARSKESSCSIDRTRFSGLRPVMIMEPASRASGLSIESRSVTAEKPINEDSSLTVPEPEITHFEPS